MYDLIWKVRYQEEEEHKLVNCGTAFELISIPELARPVTKVDINSGHFTLGFLSDFQNWTITLIKFVMRRRMVIKWKICIPISLSFHYRPSSMHVEHA